MAKIDKQQWEDLMARYVSGELTEKEKLWLNNWFYEESKKTEFEGQQAAFLHHKDIIWQKTLIKAGLSVTEKKLVIRLWPQIVAVAAAVVLLFFGIYFFKSSRYSDRSVEKGSLFVNDIPPGKQGATLTLANGKQVSLSDVENGEIAREAGVVVTKTVDGQVVYEIASTTKHSGGGQYNTLSTAKGETYQIKLPDGSLVWLNAASSITYTPDLINEGKRVVKLQGEAYFEIFKNKKLPFIVETYRQKIEVLGTHFNVESYNDEPAVKTTLTEGSVVVSRLSAALKSPLSVELQQVLKPGQQAVNTGEQLSVKAVDTEVALGWKTGKIFFDNESLESIMRKVSRWYDVDVVYKGDVKQLTFQGVVSRTKNLSSILDFFKRAGNLAYTIKGKTVTISNQ